jgi:AmpD protein
LEREQAPSLANVSGGPKLKLNREGILEGAAQIASSNCDERPEGEAITLVVIHAISLPPGEFGGEAIQRLFTNALDCAAHPSFDALRGLRVSAHFLIRRDGEVVQFVPCGKRAWHAGTSCYAGRDRCNDFSVGIELEGTEDIAYTDPQYDALTVLVDALYARYQITDIVAHSDIAPGRKTDPGKSFDWERLRAPARRG